MVAKAWSNLLLEFKCSSIGLHRWVIATSCWPAKVVFTDRETGISCDVQMLGWCLKRVRSQKYHPFALMRHLVCCGSTRPQCRFSMPGFLKRLSFRQIWVCQPSVMCLLWHTTGIVCSLSVKNKSQLGLVKKSGERQQCCDNSRVKGVNMRREFHAWQVCRMAPVFSLFTHANEQYADEQTWAQPCLPTAQNWQEACWCGSATSLWIPVCVADSDGFVRDWCFSPCKWGFCYVLSVGYSWCFWQLEHSKVVLFQTVYTLKSPWNCILIASYSLKLHISCSNNVVVGLYVLRNLQVNSKPVEY